MNPIKKYLYKKSTKTAAKKGAEKALKREIQFISAAVVTFALSQVLRKVAHKYPQLKFLKTPTSGR